MLVSKASWLNGINNKMVGVFWTKVVVAPSPFHWWFAPPKTTTANDITPWGKIKLIVYQRWEFMKENMKVRKKEKKNSTKKAIKKKRKQGRKQESTKKVIKKKRKVFLFSWSFSCYLDRFLGRVLVFFLVFFSWSLSWSSSFFFFSCLLTFLFPLINSHLWMR